MAECEINPCVKQEYEEPIAPTPVESDLVQVYDSIEQITNPNSNHIYVVGNDVYVFDGTRFLHTNDCNIPPYTGEYTVTAPSTDNLVLPTKDMLMTDDLTIEANHEIEDGLIDGSLAIDTYFNDRITNVKSYMFYDSKMRVINLPNLLTGGTYAFSGNNNSLVEEIYVPRQTNIGHNAFTYNPNLRVIDVGKHFSTGQIVNCPRLTTIIFRMGSVYAPPNVNAFNGTPFAPNGAGGYVYVLQTLLSRYQSSQAWADYANVLEFRPIEGSEYELEE